MKTELSEQLLKKTNVQFIKKMIKNVECTLRKRELKYSS